jgi:hypothetical protein
MLTFEFGTDVSKNATVPTDPGPGDAPAGVVPPFAVDAVNPVKFAALAEYTATRPPPPPPPYGVALLPPFASNVPVPARVAVVT